jgi:hypothetical protein
VFSYVAVIGPALMGQLRNLHRLCVCCATSMPAQLIFTVTSPSATSAPGSKHRKDSSLVYLVIAARKTGFLFHSSGSAG